MILFEGKKVSKRESKGVSECWEGKKVIRGGKVRGEKVSKRRKG
jgi:hypothetical protein